MSRSRRFPAASQPPVVRAVHNPPGGEHHIYVRNAPSGQVYFVAWKTPFEIRDEDVAWFFEKWAHRQWLTRLTPESRAAEPEEPATAEEEEASKAEAVAEPKRYTEAWTPRAPEDLEA